MLNFRYEGELEVPGGITDAQTYMEDHIEYNFVTAIE